MSPPVTFGAAEVLSVDAWFRLNGLAGIQATPCRRCGATADEACLAGTGITASVPCAVRLADAAASAGLAA